MGSSAVLQLMTGRSSALLQLLMGNSALLQLLTGSSAVPDGEDFCTAPPIDRELLKGIKAPDGEFY